MNPFWSATALVVGRDPLKADVRCIACGVRYKMEDWAKLYEQGRAAS